MPTLVAVALALGLGLAAPAAAAEPLVVEQAGKAFSVTAATVKKGEPIVFRNNDDVTHNVYSQSDGFAFDLKAQKPGQESEVKFAGAGDVKVRCAIHPKMKLEVKVVE